MREREKSIQIAIRLPVSLLERLDGYAERLQKEAPWSNASRADACRALISHALDQLEKPQPPRRKKR